MASIKNSLQGLDMAKAMRLKQIQDEWQQFPGRAPNGTGLTGLNPNDAKGYSDMLNEQTEGMNLENEAQGKAPMRVRLGGEIASQGHGIASDPTSSLNTSTGPYGAFGAGTGGQSASLLGLQQAATVAPGYQPNTPDLALITKAKKRGIKV